MNKKQEDCDVAALSVFVVQEGKDLPGFTYESTFGWYHVALVS
jgi:hypothetical protein